MLTVMEGGKHISSGRNRSGREAAVSDALAEREALQNPAQKGSAFVKCPEKNLNFKN